MHRDPHTRHVVGLADLLGQLEHPDEHRRHPLAVGDAVPLDQLQRLLGVKPVHQHDGSADRVDRPAEAQWRSVIERCGAQVHGVGVESVHRSEHRGVRVHGLAHLPLGQLRLDPLGPAGGARGVQHVLAAGLVVERCGGDACQSLLVVLETGHRPAVGETVADERKSLGDSGSGRRGVRRHDQRPGSAVVHHVGGLRRGQVPVDHSDVQPGPQRRPVHLQHPHVVARHEGEVIAGTQPRRAQVPGQPRRPFVELAVGELLTGGGADDRGLVGCGGYEVPRKHVRLLLG